MEIEENVYAKETGTEEVATAKKGDNTAETPNGGNASAVPEKFKDVDALARAYAALQSEFTRRSQRLKELERRAENFKEDRQERSGAEKLRKNAQVRKLAAKEFDEFVAKTEGSDDRNGQKDLKPAEDFAVPPKGESEKTTNAAEAETVSTEGTATKATEDRSRESAGAEEKQGNFSSMSVNAEESSGTARQPVAESGSAALLSHEELYQTVNNNESVRLRIIGEYLASIGRNGAPLTTGNAGTLTTPPLRAKSIGDAGNMALRYLKAPFEKE